MRFLSSAALSLLALAAVVGSAAAEGPRPGPRPQRRPAPVATSRPDGQFTGQGGDQVFEQAIARSRKAHGHASRDQTANDATGTAGGSGSGISRPIALGALGAAGLAFFIHSLGNHDEQFSNMPLTPVNPTGGIIPPEAPVTNPGPDGVTPPGNGGTPPNTDTPNPNVGAPNPPTDNTGSPNPDGDNPNVGGGPIVTDVPPELSLITPETTTPEPVSMTLLGTGLVGMGGVSLRRRYRDWKTRSGR